MVPRSGCVNGRAFRSKLRPPRGKAMAAASSPLVAQTGLMALGLAHIPEAASALKAGKEIEPALCDGRDIKSHDRAPRLPGIGIAEIWSRKHGI